ncbi:unnamed protein product [Schistocephalus solidus]|uniref:BTB/POZ domain-containing protein n=1 Tax=Schistocephalus solidus TaxID=70667 RepID=A0A183TLP7_SCHSO|nr:unnamed protein product [Schistocephalus solidus]
MSSETPVNSKARYFLQAHVYNSVESVLSRLTPIACRIFGVLFGDESCPRLKLPDEVDNAELSDGFGRFDWKISRDAHKLAKWIEDIGPTSAVLSVASIARDAGLKSLLSRCVPESVSRTQLDLREALQLAEILDLSIVSDVKKIVSSLLCPDSTSEPPTQLSSVNTSSPSTLHRWPCSILKAYRYGLLQPHLLSAILKGTGVILPHNMHYLIDMPSTCKKSQILRFLHYCFIYSYESVLMGVSTISSAPPRVFEVDLNASKDLSVSCISLRPVLLPTSEEKSARSLVYGEFSFSPCPQIPDWLNDLALCLAIWHTQKRQDPSHKQCLRHSECPFVLSACVCALASQFNRITSWNLALAHYSLVADSLEQEVSSVEVYGDQYSDKDTVHSAVEIQDVYAELVSLLNFVEAISLETSCASKEFPSSFNCYPDHWVFPSNRLFFFIAKSLNQVPTESRTKLAMRSRLPRLFVPSNSPDVSESCVATISDLSFMLQLLNSTNIILPEISCTSVPANLRGMQNDSTMLLSEREALGSIFANVPHSSFTENGSRNNNYGSDSVGTTSFPSFRSRCEATDGFLLATDSADEGARNSQWTQQSVGRVAASSCPQSDFPLPGSDTRRNAVLFTPKESPSDSSISKWSRGATTLKSAGIRNKVPSSTNGWGACDSTSRSASFSLDNTDVNGSPNNFDWERRPPEARTDTNYVTNEFSKASQSKIQAPTETDKSRASDRPSKEYGPPSGSVRRPAVVGSESCEVSTAIDHNDWNRSPYDASEGCLPYGSPKYSSQSVDPRRCPNSLEDGAYFQRSYSVRNYDEWGTHPSDRDAALGLAPTSQIQSSWNHPSDCPQPREESSGPIDHPPLLPKGSASWDVLSASKFDCTYGSSGDNLPQLGFDRRPTSRGDCYKPDFSSEPPNYYTPPSIRGRGRGGRRGSDYASRLRARVSLR